MVGKRLGAIQIIEGLQIKVRTSGLQEKVPENITNEPNIHIQTLRRWQEEIADVTAKHANKLDEERARAMKSNVGGRFACIQHASDDLYCSTHGLDYDTWQRAAEGKLR